MRHSKVFEPTWLSPHRPFAIWPPQLSSYTLSTPHWRTRSSRFRGHSKTLSWVPDQWHKELLGKMFLNVPTIRPAVLPESLRGFLNDLRGFRHLFRHAYDLEIDPVRLKRPLDNWERHRDELLEALDVFCTYLLAQAQEGGKRIN
jgi:hypothetical protein